MTALDQRMIALMGVNAVRHLHAVADVLVIAPAQLDHLVAEHRVGKPGDHPLEHVLVVELAGHPAGALWLRPIADLDRESDDLDRAVLPAEIPVGGCRIVVRQRCLDEARRVKRKPELAIPAVAWVDRGSLALRVHVPAETVVDEFLEALFALDRKAGAAATGDIVPLNAGVLPARGLAGEVDIFAIALQIRAR